MNPLHGKYLEMCDGDDIMPYDIVNAIFEECRVSIKMTTETNELVSVIRAKRYGKLRKEDVPLGKFIDGMGYIDNELDIMSIQEIKDEYMKAKGKK